MTERKPVYVVSDNIISSLGFTTAGNIRSILQLKTGIETKTCHGGLDPPSPVQKIVIPHLMQNPKIIQEIAGLRYATPAMTKHILDSLFPAAYIDNKKLSQLIHEHNLTEYNLPEATAILSIIFALQTTAIDLSGKENLFILSTTKGNIAGLSGKIPPEKESHLGYTAQRIAGYFKMENTPVVISNACVSGVTALHTASRLLEAGLVENVVVTGIDFVTPFTVSGFESFKSISPKPCKPFDARRDGLSIGEGAGTLVLTNNPKNIAGKKEIQIFGGATSNDANHISGPSRTGDGLSRAIENALYYTGVDRSEIDFINLHGTATVFNDDMESKALQLSRLSGVPVNGLKGYFGHTLGASGVIETIVCVESLRNQTVYATMGFETPGTSGPLNVVKEHRKMELHTLMKSASGFGGVNSAIILTDKIKSLKQREKIVPVFSKNIYTVRNNQIKRNETVLFETAPDLPFHEFIKLAFKNLQTDYAKFYKMDDFCKLGFVAFEYLRKEIPDFETGDKSRWALVFSTSASSLDTDLKHLQSIADPDRYFPAPAVFVYTLPNILLGEIAIKNKIQGETLCFVNENPDINRLKTYLQLLFNSTGTERAIFGTIDYLLNDYEVIISYAERKSM